MRACAERSQLKLLGSLHSESRFARSVVAFKLQACQTEGGQRTNYSSSLCRRVRRVRLWLPRSPREEPAEKWGRTNLQRHERRRRRTHEAERAHEERDRLPGQQLKDADPRKRRRCGRRQSRALGVVGTRPRPDADASDRTGAHQRKELLTLESQESDPLRVYSRQNSSCRRSFQPTLPNILVLLPCASPTPSRMQIVTTKSSPRKIGIT